jgi:hypothetical protein
MTVERIQVGHQTRYALRDGADPIGTLTYGEVEEEPAAWEISLPGPGGGSDFYGARRFAAPDAAQLRAWLAPIFGTGHAAELASAVDAEPPQTSGWRPGGSDGG